jgi:signal peptide peptidase SppA
MVGATAGIGSIGVLMVHTEYSELDKRVGIKTTHLTAGKYKALGNSAEPLSDLAREALQAELDYIYDIFISAVARNREVSANEVREKMADGRIFIGRQAVDAGLADSVGTFEAALDLAEFMQKYIKQTGSKFPKGESNVR